MKLNPCKHCGLIPDERKADVIEDCLCVYYHCSCGACGPWRRTREEAAAQWNILHGVVKAQPSKAMTVLMKKKGELAYAG
jgi:hypothetical protein